LDKLVKSAIYPALSVKLSPGHSFKSEEEESNLYAGLPKR